MKKVNSWLWGCVLVALGVILGMNALGIAQINIFFPGWWTLFIIVPSAIGVLTDKRKSGAMAGLVIGICLLLACLDVVSFGMLWKLLIPVILVFAGVAVIVRNTTNEAVRQKIRRAEKARRQEGRETIVEATIVSTDKDGQTKTEKVEVLEEDDDDDDDDDEDEDEDERNQDRQYWSTFGEQDVNYAGKAFDGCGVDAVFGAINLDLRGAEIRDEAVVRASAVFGGVTVYVPEGVKVETAATTIFGSVADKQARKESKEKKTEKIKKPEKTIYIDATCVFGSVEIK